MTTIKFVTVAEEITIGKDAIDSIDSTKKLTITSRSPTYPPLNFQTLSWESLKSTLTHLSLLPLPSLVTDVSRLATSKKIVTLPFEVPIIAKYVIGKNDHNSTALMSTSPLRSSSNGQTK